MAQRQPRNKGCIPIDQRNWRRDIDEPKTAKTKRFLAPGDLGPRYKVWTGKLKHRGPESWVFPQADDLKEPMWDSGVRQSLKRAANAVGLDSPSFGPHSAARQHHVAAGRRRQQHRDQQDRRQRQH